MERLTLPSWLVQRIFLLWLPPRMALHGPSGEGACEVREGKGRGHEHLSLDLLKKGRGVVS